MPGENDPAGAHAKKTNALEVPPQAQQSLDEQRVELAGTKVPAGVRVALEQAISESFITSFRLVMPVTAGLALASAITAALII